MLKYIENMHWILGSILTVVLFSIIGIIFLFIIRWLFSREKLKDSHEVAGFAYGVIGVVYAVLLGFNVVNVQERFNKAVEISEREANAVADLYRDAAMLPAPFGKEIQSALKEYISLSLRDEWSASGDGFAVESVIKQVGVIWSLYYKVEPITEREKIWLQESISKLNDFTNIRLQRVYNSKESLGDLMWVLLYAGAIITIGFLGFFWVQNIKLHIMVIILLSSLVGFMLYLIQALDSVYSGAISIKPEALVSVRDLLNKWYTD